jgi:hypothetical protein
MKTLLSMMWPSRRPAAAGHGAGQEGGFRAALFGVKLQKSARCRVSSSCAHPLEGRASPPGNSPCGAIESAFL